MREILIPYSPAMVRARRAGLKTQTRRIAPIANLNITPHGDDYVTWGVSFTKPVKGILGIHSGGKFSDLQARSIIASQFNPYGQPGDHLLTREAWRTLTQYDALPPRDVPAGAPIWYEADGVAPAEFGRYRHGRFMCRWMSRGIDMVTAVRVERLQDIGEMDAVAEGVRQMRDESGCWVGREGPGRLVTPWPTPREAYRDLWESINGPGSWNANPWVWVVEFKQVTR